MDAPRPEAQGDGADGWRAALARALAAVVPDVLGPGAAGQAVLLLVELDGGPDVEGAAAERLEGGRRLREALRRDDVVLEAGPGRLAALLPATDVDAGLAAARRVSAALASPASRADADAVPVVPRATVGVAVLGTGDAPAATVAAAAADADRARARGTRHGGGATEAVAGALAGASPTVREALDLARDLLGLEVAYVTRHDATHQHFVAVAGDPSTFGVDETTSLPLEQTYCQAILEGRLPHLMPDVGVLPEAAALPVTEAAGVGAFVSVPVHDAAGDLLGTLCAAGHVPRPDLDERDVRLLRVLARLLAGQLEPPPAVR